MASSYVLGTVLPLTPNKNSHFSLGGLEFGAASCPRPSYNFVWVLGRVDRRGADLDLVVIAGVVLVVGSWGELRWA